MAENTNTEREATGPAEVWLRSRYGAYRGHFAWRELEEAFNAGRASLSLPAAGQEPVAHRYKDARGHWRYVGAPLTKGWDFPQNLNHEPLYAAPQPAVAAGWVSVKDRLPPPYTEVLIYPRPTAYCCEGEVDTQGQWHYDEYETGFGNHHIKCNVTHWMTLPPAPSTEGESP